MMDESAIKAIAQLGADAATRVVEIDGEWYQTDGLGKGLRRVPEFRPMCSTLVVYGLTGLVDFVELNLDDFNWARHMAYVQGPTTVSVYSSLITENLTREIPVQADLPDMEQFPFGMFMDIENFIIQLGSRFVAGNDRDLLAEFVSRVTVDDSAEIVDDGVSQRATVRKGISGGVREQKTAPSIVHLQPYRTFREIEQPKSPFLFRLRRGQSEVQCGLFEADGGRWALDAMAWIAAWLTDHLPEGLKVIA